MGDMATELSPPTKKEDRTPERVRPDTRRLSQVMEERPDTARQDSGGSSSSDDYSVSLAHPGHEPSFDGLGSTGDESDGHIQYTPGSTLDGYTPLTGNSSSQPSWNSQKQQRPREGSVGEIQEAPPPPSNGVAPSPRPQRPSAPARTPSSTYNPVRKPAHLLSYQESRHRSFSGTGLRRDPNAQYRAQEKAYIQQLRQDPYNGYLDDEPYTPSLGYSTDSETEEESPSSDVHLDADTNYDQESQLFFTNDDNHPSIEELQVPENRERMEWHSMLASVLKGDVVKQEKQRLIGTTEQKGEKALNNELWLGIRAGVCGRNISAQRRMIEEGRAGIIPIVEAIIAFQVKGETEAGKPAAKQVLDVVQKIEQCESLFPTRQALGQAIERAGSEAFIESSEAVISWHNTTELINTELEVLRGWVGNEELDFAKAQTPSPGGAGLTDDSTFLERIHKDDGLTSLQGDEDGKHSMLQPVAEVIKKAKTTLIKNAKEFAKRHLPPYIEELLTLINFPSRLIQEIIRMRLKYVNKMKDPALLSPMMQTSMISQFQILLKLAVRIKQDYTVISQPEPGWELPPCIDDAFDFVILDALKFYFKMLNAKLVGIRNTFKEAEILEQEWEFSNEIGRYLEGGDVEVAEQFQWLDSEGIATPHHSLRARIDKTAGGECGGYGQAIQADTGFCARSAKKVVPLFKTSRTTVRECNRVQYQLGEETIAKTVRCIDGDRSLLHLKSYVPKRWHFPYRFTIVVRSSSRCSVQFLEHLSTTTRRSWKTHRIHTFSLFGQKIHCIGTAKRWRCPCEHLPWTSGRVAFVLWPTDRYKGCKMRAQLSSKL